MAEPLALVAVGIAALGVVGSVVPAIPGALLSIAGVLLYWWSTGYAEPSFPLLAGLLLVGVVALAVDLVGAPLAAGAAGASRWTVVAAGVVGLALFVVSGPLGGILGVVGVVFVLELRRHGDVRRGGTAALYVVVGVLGSAIVQLLLTGSMFAILVLVALT